MLSLLLCYIFTLVYSHCPPLICYSHYKALYVSPSVIVCTCYSWQWSWPLLNQPDPSCCHMRGIWWSHMDDMEIHLQMPWTRLCAQAFINQQVITSTNRQIENEFSGYRIALLTIKHTVIERVIRGIIYNCIQIRMDSLLNLAPQGYFLMSDLWEFSHANVPGLLIRNTLICITDINICKCPM